MKITSDLSMTSRLVVGRTEQDWGAAYEVYGERPTVVLDAVNGVFASPTKAPTISDAFSFSRGSTATGSDELNSPVTYGVDEPAFDYSFGPRALRLDAEILPRLADELYLNNTGWFASQEGTIVVNFVQRDQRNAYDRIFSINDGTVNNRLEVFADQSRNRYVAGMRISGSTQFARHNANTSIEFGIEKRIAFSFQAGSFAFSVNGASALVDTNTQILTGPTRLSIGSDHAGMDVGAIDLRSFRLYPKAFTAAETEALAS